MSFQKEPRSQKRGDVLLLFLDLLMVMLVVLSLMLAADYKATHPERLPWLKSDRSTHLGAEYNEIAKAIVAGRGFSDPFRVPSGPTAWMPPVLPYLTAAIYWLTGNGEEIVVEVLVAFHGLAVLAMGLIVVRQARKLGLACLGYLVLIIGLAANFHELFQKTHDTGLLLMVVSGLWFGFVRCWSPPKRGRTSCVWGAFGGFCALCSPVIGFAWAVLTAFRWWPWRQGGNSCMSQGYRPLLFATAVSVIVIAPWTVRNRLVLGKWIPIKSNAMYELWQSQCQGYYGLLDGHTIAGHPWSSSGEQRQRYRELGEVRFIEGKGELAIASIRRQPLDFIQRMFARADAALLFYQPFSEHEGQLGSGWPLLLKRLVFPLPLLALLIILVRRSPPLEAELAAAIGLWACALLPYVAISYYDRYAAPLVGLKLLVVLYALHTLLSSRQGRRYR